MTLPKHIFCQCMKPWKSCITKKNSYKIDVRDLITRHNLNPYLSKQDINYDFVNQKWLPEKFECRFRDKKNQ